jgi:hypothetical protein
MSKAEYRKVNDRTQNSSTYHKKDGTNVRAKMKNNLRKTLTQANLK